MDLSAVRTRRKKTPFRPWNSYLAKKGAADAEAAARARELQYHANLNAHPNRNPTRPAPLIRLSAGLIDTYEGINAAYYERKTAMLPLDNSSDEQAAVNPAPNPPDAQPDVQSVNYHRNLPATDNQDAAHRRKKSIDSAASAAKPKSTATTTTTSTVLRPSASPQLAQYCDKNFDYIVRTGEMFNNRYMLEKVIGRGSFGQVVRAYDTRENTHVAIKIIKNNALYVEQALSEVRMTSYLNRIDPEDVHSIMRLRDKFIFRGHQCLVLELLSFSLYDLLRSTEFYGVSLNLVRKFCKQILRCLAFLARPDVNIAHCDLKPENVLLRHPQRSAIKVVDFGASCRITESMFTYVQSRFYRAPEVILGLPYETQVDVWSLGCMLIELHTGYPVFAGTDEADQMAIIVERLGLPPSHMLENGKKTALFFDRDPDSGEWVIKNGLSQKHERVIPGSKPINAFVDYHTGATNGRRKRVSGGHSEVDYEIFLSLAAKMLHYDPKERITADEALRDSFVRGSSTRSGRDSPPPIPPMSTVGDNVVKELDPGRKAPVQRMRAGGDIGSNVAMHADASIGDLAELSADMGGKLRLSKSEPAFDPVPKKTFVFATSDWAEEVGIEPPPWRAGGASASNGNEVAMRRRDIRRNLGSAGSGCQILRQSCRSRVVSTHGNGYSQWDCRRSKERFSFGIGNGDEANAVREAALIDHGGVKSRAKGFNPPLPRGHGNALLLFLP